MKHIRAPQSLLTRHFQFFHWKRDYYKLPEKSKQFLPFGTIFIYLKTIADKVFASLITIDYAEELNLTENNSTSVYPSVCLAVSRMNLSSFQISGSGALSLEYLSPLSTQYGWHCFYQCLEWFSQYYLRNGSEKRSWVVELCLNLSPLWFALYSQILLIILKTIENVR